MTRWIIRPGFISVIRLSWGGEGADVLLPGIDADTVIADKAFDADERVIEPLRKAGKTIVIPPKSNRTTSPEYDQDLYQARHLIENFFARLKQFRAIATRLINAPPISSVPSRSLLQ